MPGKAHRESSHHVDRLTLAHFWQAGLRYKKLLWLSALFPLGALFQSTLVPLYIGRILATLGRAGGNPEHYVPYLVAAAIVGIVCNRVGIRALLTYQAHVQRNLQTEALNTLLARSVGFHNDNVGGKLVSDAIEYANAFGTLSNTFFSSALPLVIALVTGSAVIFWDSWQLGLLVLVMVAFAVGSGYRDHLRRGALRKDRLVASKKMTAHLADAIVNVQTVKTFAHEREEIKRSDDLSEHLMQMRIRDWTLAGMRGNNRIIVLTLLQIAFIIAVVHLVRQRPALLGIGIFAFSYTITLSNRLFDINTMLRTVEDGLLNASNMTEIMQEQVEIVDRPGASALHVSKGALDLNNVTFRYHDSTDDRGVFNDLQLHVRPGEKIGLVGPSGGGKSTLTRLLLRFEDIDAGEILIDGQSIAEVTQRSLREAISYVPQEPLLFHRPVKDNIAYGAPDASQAKITEAAKAAYADDFIRQLPKGYDTVVGERGVKLSGGQRQRIAIARAILKDAPILVLDEATSALDSESEVLIQAALQELMKGRTTLVIAHRLSTIQKMDRILVLDHGEIVEQGSHKELLTHKGIYAKLWAHQSGGFLED